MTASALPNKPGNYIIVLRNTSSLPIRTQFSIAPILTTFNYKEEEYKVIYVGKSSKSLRSRDYQQHFKETAGNSTVRKSIGCLQGFQLIPRDINSSQNSKTKFSEKDEDMLTTWMKTNLLLFYYDNNEYTDVEKELIRTYNPPLNLQDNFNKTNLAFRKELSALRSSLVRDTAYHNQVKTDIVHSGQIYCHNCNLNLVIPDDLKNEEYIKCLSCGSVFQNPFYIQIKKRKEHRQWKIALIIIGIAFLLNLAARIGTSNESSNVQIKNHESQKGPTQTEAMAGVRSYLKRHYLKDPDSYKGISWEAFGIYNKDNNTYFALHKYRAKNSCDGYVVEEKMFVLDSDGNVIKAVDDINEIINGY